MNTTKEKEKQKKLAKMYLTNFVEKTTEIIRAEVIAQEHARLRALFEKKKAESLQHDLTGQDTEEETRLINIGRASGINDCLSELQDTKEERA